MAVGGRQGWTGIGQADPSSSPSLGVYTYSSVQYHITLGKATAEFCRSDDDIILCHMF